MLDAIIPEDGIPRVIRVIRSLDWQFDESAINALQQWRFSPAMKDGNPVKVRMNDTATPPRAIRQAIYPVTQENKAQILLSLLRREGVNSAIVFARTRSRADRVTKLLARNRISVVAIHGGRSQNQRNAALAGF